MFVTWFKQPEGPSNPLSILAHQLRRRFRSNRSLLRGARLAYLTARPEGSLVFRPVRPGLEASPAAKTVRCSAALLGSTTLASRFAHQSPNPPRETRKSGSRVALEEDRLFRRLFPAGPGKNPKALSIACRRRSDLWPPAAPSCRCRLPDEAGTAVPITQAPCTLLPSRESEKYDDKPVDNGDIGNK